VGRVIAGLSGIGLTRAAASLAFTSLLGLVPLATSVLAFVAQVPAFEEWLRALEGFLLRFLLPGIGETVVRTYIVGFVEQASQLSTLSILLSGGTAVLLMLQIDEEINLIFGVHRQRPFWRRLLACVFALTLGPVLFGASLWAATWAVMESVAKVPYADAVVEFVEGPLPLAIAVATLTWVYRALPARQVRWLHALAGGAR
jgi:membrane protein